MTANVHLLLSHGADWHVADCHFFASHPQWNSKLRTFMKTETETSILPRLQTPSTKTLKKPQDGGHREEDAGNESGEGQRHGQLRHLGGEDKECEHEESQAGGGAATGVGL